VFSLKYIKLEAKGEFGLYRFEVSPHLVLNTKLSCASTANSWETPTRVVHGPHYEARTRPEPDFHFWCPI